MSYDTQEPVAELVTRLVTSVANKDRETGIHLLRIGAYAARLAAELGWPKEQCEMLRLAAPLHDVGKVAMPDAILLKEGPLTDDEFAVMRQHPTFGHEVLSMSDDPVMTMAARIALNHHERWNGGGYPRGLAGNEIPIEASITTLVDVQLEMAAEKRSVEDGERAAHTLKSSRALGLLALSESMASIESQFARGETPQADILKYARTAFEKGLASLEQHLSRG